MIKRLYCGATVLSALILICGAGSSAASGSGLRLVRLDSRLSAFPGPAPVETVIGEPDSGLSIADFSLTGNGGVLSAAAVPDSFPRQKVLAEMFSSVTCSSCYIADYYLEESVFPAVIEPGILTVINYILDIPGILKPLTRMNYYVVIGVPSLYLNGDEEIYPTNLTVNKVKDTAKKYSSFRLDIQGRPPDTKRAVYTKVTVTTATREPEHEYNFFMVVTELKVYPLGWDPPYYPPNGQTDLSHMMRLMVTGESGKAFTAKPGKEVVFEQTFSADSSWNLDNCELVVFIQHLDTREVMQSDSRKLEELTIDQAPNCPPTVAINPGSSSFSIVETDTLTILVTRSDPNPLDTVKLRAWFSSNGTAYQTSLPRNVTFSDSVFRFIPDKLQAGVYYFMVIGTDRAGLADTVKFRVDVADKVVQNEKTCDFSSDGKVSILDLISFLRLMRDNPGDPRLDWNGDGVNSIFDLIALLVDITRGTCPDAAVHLAGASMTDAASIHYASREDLEYLEKMMARAGLTAEQEAALRAAFYGEKDHAGLPGAFSLSQNSPNPFNPATTISFSVPPDHPAQVALKVYDLKGRMVKTLVKDIRASGDYTVTWDGRDDSGGDLPSGVYFYRMSAGAFVQIRKMILLK